MDSRSVRAVVIPADSAEPVSVVTLEAPAGLDRVLGGRPGLVPLTGTDGQVYCNEHGRQSGLEPNPRATRFVDRYVPGFARHDMILGPVVLVGVADDGLEGDVPADLAEAAQGDL